VQNALGLLSEIDVHSNQLRSASRGWPIDETAYIYSDLYRVSQKQGTPCIKPKVKGFCKSA
jgi:hypothetical protein